ncbi:glycosyltransferase family 2 protein [Actinomyces faecalis]|uniref:glycosyltransferase family 2 protein n=1 Tax=Actinomyces faecalis TaxID=2722820 RepID=UPI0015521C8A|nr:glycosyltransferase family 2 protein [Actinomyces faecalis]
MSGRRPSVRAVVVNWRQPELTIRACHSLLPQLHEGDALVVVDNASGDDSAQRLREAGLSVVETEVNLGFGAGVNAGAAGTSQDVLVLLNNDAVAEPGFLDALVAPLADASSPVGATTALMVLSGRWVPVSSREEALTDLDGNRWRRVSTHEEAQGLGTVLVNSTGNIVDASGNGYDRSWLEPLESLEAEPDVFGLCGGACAIRTSVWTTLGGFREDLFMYYEDTDLSWRLREHGYTVRFVKEAVVHHEHAASSGTSSPMFIRVNTRNRILVAAEHAPRRVLYRALVRTTVRAMRTGLRGPVAQGLREAVVMLAHREHPRG